MGPGKPNLRFRELSRPAIGMDVMVERSASPAESNQSPPYEDVDLFASDQPLRDAVAANGAASQAAALSSFGRRFGSAAMFEQGRLANTQPPKLETSEAGGRRQDVVVFHPDRKSVV